MPVRGILTGEPIRFKEVNSINSLFRGQVYLDNGSIKSCLLKDIDRIELINELLSNFIATYLKLPVPVAVLAFVPNKFNKKKLFKKSFETKGGRLVFCSVDVQTPNLAQRLDAAHPLAHKIIINSLINWNKKSHLYGFDTWVANVDRHKGNLLFGENNQVWLIDHGRCFTKEDWVPSDLNPNIKYINRLQEWYTKLMDQIARLQTTKDLQLVEAEISKINLDSMLSGSLADTLTTLKEKEALIKFLSARANRVAADGAVALQG